MLFDIVVAKLSTNFIFVLIQIKLYFFCIFSSNKHIGPGPIVFNIPIFDLFKFIGYTSAFSYQKQVFYLVVNNTKMAYCKRMTFSMYDIFVSFFRTFGDVLEVASRKCNTVDSLFNAST